MAGWDFSKALELRDLLEGIVKAEVNRVRPQYQYATVVSIDRIRQRCTVLYQGDTQPIPVNMGAIQPMSVGQRVRIDGLLGDRYISDVIGQAFLTGPEKFAVALSSGVRTHDDQFGHTPYGLKNNFGEAQLWGTIRRTTGSFASNSVVLTVPVKYRPEKTTFGLLTSQWVGGQYVVRTEMRADGGLSIFFDHGTPPVWIALDQMRWPIATP